MSILPSGLRSGMRCWLRFNFKENGMGKSTGYKKAHSGAGGGSEKYGANKSGNRVPTATVGSSQGCCKPKVSAGSAPDKAKVR